MELVVVVSDHGTGVIPEYPKLMPHQRRLLWPRIILGVIARHIKIPKKINYPVHQVDVAPLIASITGITGKVTWIGRDPTLGSGTPWISKTKDRLAYRTTHQICATFLVQGKIKCWYADPEIDPLLEESLPEMAENRALSDQLRLVVNANEALIESGDFSFSLF